MVLLLLLFINNNNNNNDNNNNYYAQVRYYVMFCFSGAPGHLTSLSQECQHHPGTTLVVCTYNRGRCIAKYIKYNRPFVLLLLGV